MSDGDSTAKMMDKGASAAAKHVDLPDGLTEDANHDLGPAPAGEKTVGTTGSMFDASGSIGKQFTTEGAIGGTAQKPIPTMARYEQARKKSVEPEDFDLPDKEYNEEEDEDFNPEAAQDEAAESSSSEDEDADAAADKATGSKSNKRKAEAVEELDSGDEATIEERRKGRRKKQKKGEDGGDAPGGEQDEDSGTEGGFVRTRAQRTAEKTERKERRRTIGGEVTIDVDAIWQELQKLPVGRPAPPPPPMKQADGDGLVEDAEQDKENKGDDDLVVIKRRIEYAGEVTEIEAQVPRSSKAARQYFKEHLKADPSYRPSVTSQSELRRPLKRLSLFEPNPTGLVKGVPPEKLRPRAPNRLDVLLQEQRIEEERKKKAEKMTTVQKSALDWKGFVDSQGGLREELDDYGKSKQGYLAREEFLGRADLARDLAAREARSKQ
ncbi:BCNT-domain-containing protein [Teratosphaeria nubilosa]|uniref:SWR1-complex protein 5 n=1 Tax=Teratosphaeria nubilosa TaxID=161662 RepID=A0A6G1KTX5_9PEZI|nr:BCNT-domain-containing protein [Teratosphaeria nubilosa]